MKLKKIFWLGATALLWLGAAKWAESVNLSTEFAWFSLAILIPVGFIWAITYLAKPDNPIQKKAPGTKGTGK